MKIVANSTPLIELSKIRRLELLRDQSLEESENLPEPDVIAAEIILLHKLWVFDNMDTENNRKLEPKMAWIQG